MHSKSDRTFRYTVRLLEESLRDIIRLGILLPEPSAVVCLLILPSGITNGTVVQGPVTGHTGKVFTVTPTSWTKRSDLSLIHI